MNISALGVIDVTFQLWVFYVYPDPLNELTFRSEPGGA